MHDPQSQGHIHGWMNLRKGEKEINTYLFCGRHIPIIQGTLSKQREWHHLG